MPDIYEVLDAIRARPGMYVGREGTLSNLWCLLLGYQMGLDDRKYDDEHRVWSSHFRRFVSNKLPSTLSETTAGYHKIILEHTGGDEARALGLFFQLLDEYRESEQSE